jgi:hypothetical protein
MNRILDQLARNAGLLPDNLSAAILAGQTPLKEIVLHLVIASMDAHEVVVGDPQSSWDEKRISRMGLVVAFLAAMAVVGKTGEPTWT